MNLSVRYSVREFYQRIPTRPKGVFTNNAVPDQRIFFTNNALPGQSIERERCYDTTAMREPLCNCCITLFLKPAKNIRVLAELASRIKQVCRRSILSKQRLILECDRVYCAQFFPPRCSWTRTRKCTNEIFTQRETRVRKTAGSHQSKRQQRREHFQKLPVQQHKYQILRSLGETYLSAKILWPRLVVLWWACVDWRPSTAIPHSRSTPHNGSKVPELGWISRFHPPSEARVQPT